MNDYKVSVIIPIYGVEEYLEECLMSVVDQTLEGIQVILMDDGSLDGSTDIAKEFADKYDNFEYYRQVNGGLGNARNNGVKYAKGKYIIFLDSDDIIPEEAYEKLYFTAERNQSDMTIGQVIRFDSKGDVFSSIHEVAFSKLYDKTHITKNTDLIYDTTSWNKMIRKDFWDKHNFKFPERILYEDIPVTIPMHYLANNVSMVHDVCYKWRIRDGANKSITQRADDFTNLRDRIKVLRMVDEFFKEYVTEPELWERKHYKWLCIDIMIFVNNSVFLPEKENQEMIKIIREYLDEAIPKESYDKIPTLAREKYKCVFDNNPKRLVQLRQYEKDNYKNIKIVQRGSHFIGKFPKNIIPKENADIYFSLVNKNPNQLIENIISKDDKYIIDGYMFITGLDVPSKDKQSFQAYLFKSETGEKIPVFMTSRISKRAQKKFFFSIDNETKKFHIRRMKGAGYEIIIDVKKDIIDKNLQGEYDILIEYSNPVYQNREILLRGVNSALHKKIEKFPIIKENMLIDLKETLRKGLKVVCTQNITKVLDSSIEKNQLVCRLNQEVTNVVGIIDGKQVVDVRPQYEETKVSFDLDNFTTTKMMLGIKDGKHISPLYTKKTMRKIHFFEDSQIFENVTRNYRYLVQRRENTPVIININQKDADFSFDILFKINRIPSSQGVAELFVRDELVEEIIILGHGNYKNENGEIKTTIQVEMQNEDVVKNLYAANRQVFLKVKTDEKEYNFPIGGAETSINKTFTDKKKQYRFFLNKYDLLYLSTKKVNGFFERSKKKRDFTARFIYPLFRLLPIQKKCIVFESMWGSKFSCNPRYLYEYIDKNHKDYKCVWFLKDENIPITGNGIRVRRLSLKYVYYLATAKYFINNVNFHDDYEKRKNQIEVQTMHGTPLKTIGLDVPGDFPTKKEKKNYIRKCKRWDFLIVQSDFVGELSHSAFKFNKTLMNTGYPRTDNLYAQNNPDNIKRLKLELGLPLDKKVIMYAPTWRLRDKFHLMLEIDKLKEKLSDEYVFILRLHHFSVKGWEGIEPDGFVYDLTDYQSIEDLYIITDILITDYSSVMFDYAVLNRPMMFYTYDLESYRGKLRGFNIDIESESPGPVLFETDEVVNAIVNLDQTMEDNKKRIDDFYEKYIQYECPNSSEKVFTQMISK